MKACSVFFAFLFGVIGFNCLPLLAQEIDSASTSVRVTLNQGLDHGVVENYVVSYGNEDELRRLLAALHKDVKIRLVVPEGANPAEYLGADLAAHPNVVVIEVPLPPEESSQGGLNGPSPRKSFLGGVRNWILDHSVDLSNRATDWVIHKITWTKVSAGVCLWLWKANGMPGLEAMYAFVQSLADMETYSYLAAHASQIAANNSTQPAFWAAGGAVSFGFFLDWWFQKNADRYVRFKQEHTLSWVLKYFRKGSVNTREFWREVYSAGMWNRAVNLVRSSPQNALALYDRAKVVKTMTVDFIVSTVISGIFRQLASVMDPNTQGPLASPEFIIQHVGSNALPMFISGNAEVATNNLVQKRFFPGFVRSALFQFFGLSFWGREFLKNAGLVSSTNGSSVILWGIVIAENAARFLVIGLNNIVPDLDPEDQRVADALLESLPKVKGDVSITVIAEDMPKLKRVLALAGNSSARKTGGAEIMGQLCGNAFEVK